MAVPGNAPADLAATELFAVDAYATEFAAKVVEVDREGGRIRLDRTAFYPSGGGQPHDLGTIQSAEGTLFVTSVRREAGAIWHQVGTHPALHHVSGVISIGRATRRDRLCSNH